MLDRPYALLFALLFCSPEISHASDTLRLETTLNLDAASRRTGLIPLERPLLLNRGRTIAVASGLRKREVGTHLIRLRNYSQFLLRTPVRTYLHYDERPAGARLLFYDADHRRAGMLLTARANGRSTHLYAHWEVDTRPASPIIELGRSALGRPTEILPIGYWPGSRTFYACEVASRETPGHRDVTVMAIDNAGEPAVAGRVRTTRRVHDVHFDARNGRALIAEYAYESARGKGPVGHLVDLRTGTSRALPLPQTAYGIAFAPDGRTIHAYSSRSGALVAIDAGTGQSRIVRRVGSLGHALGRAGPNQLIVVRNAAVQLHDARTGARRGLLRTSSLFSAVAHTEGSVVAGRAIIVKNGAELAMLRVVAQ